MARRRRSGGKRGKAKFGRKTKHNLMLMRTRNLGVVGTRGAGVIAHTTGPYMGEKETLGLLDELGIGIINEAGTQYVITER